VSIGDSRRLIGVGSEASGDAGWVVVVPVKELGVAKSRLRDLAPDDRADLALAMSCDVVAAARAAEAVTAVVVITNDLRAAASTETLGAYVIADAEDAGLNIALGNAARSAAVLHPRSGTAAVSADLPSLRAAELDQALSEAAGHSRAFVPDWHTTGTTLLTARSGVPLDPMFGHGSREHHRLSGAIELLNADWLGLRRDVDTAEDLRAVAQLGVGPHTSAVLDRLGILA
jgi:2-phospho-L-lactate/phosphoenolpyruvate guanylyltransferase